MLLDDAADDADDDDVADAGYADLDGGMDEDGVGDNNDDVGDNGDAADVVIWHHRA